MGVAPAIFKTVGGMFFLLQIIIKTRYTEKLF